MEPLVIDYMNWQGEQRLRKVKPRGVSWGSNEWHPHPQWLMEAVDLEDGTIKSFAMKGIIRVI